MSSKRALVTGAAGFVGSHLADKLLAEGFEVLGVDNFSTGSARNLVHLEREPRFELIETDASEGLQLPGAIEAVFHLASPASPIDYQRLPVETMKVGSFGTYHALELAKRKRALFFLASTSEVYGDPEVSPQPESYWGRVNPVGPRAVYDEAKRFSEALASAYARMGLDVRIARIFNTYGPRMRADDGRVLPTFLSQALKGQPLTVFGDGSQTRSFCYVDDLAGGLYLLHERGDSRPTNLGNPDEVTILELAHEINELLGSSAGIVFRPLPVDDPQRRKPEITRARESLGWEPLVPRREGIIRTADSFRKLLAEGAAGRPV